MADRDPFGKGGGWQFCQFQSGSGFIALQPVAASSGLRCRTVTSASNINGITPQASPGLGRFDKPAGARDNNSMRLGALSPFGPIFGKELRSTARRRGTYILRVLYLAALMLFLFFAYTSARPYYGGGVAQRAQQQAELGFMFFAFFSMFSVIAMAIIGPILTATSVGGERLHKTLHVLLMTPINAWQIVSGKLFSRLWIALTLLGLSLPAVAMVRLLGGVEIQQMFAIFGLCIVTAVFTASVGLLFSTLINRAYAVILLSYAALFLLYAFVPFLIVAFFDGPGLESWIAAINPIATAAFIIEGSQWFSVDWIPCVVIHIGMSAGLVLLAAMLVRREASGEGSVQVPALPGQPQLAGGFSRVSRPVADNPVLWRETRRPLFFQRWQRLTAAAAVACVLLLSYAAVAANGSLDESDLQAVYTVIFHGAMLLLVCILSATAIAQEKESDTWTILLASPVPGRRIVVGKLLGLLRRLFWPSALVIAHFLIFTVTGILHPLAFLLAVWLVLAFNPLWIATGLYLSLRLGKVTVAVVLNLMIPVTIYLFAILFAAIVDEVLLRPYDDVAKELVAFYTPYGYLESIWVLSEPHRYGHRRNTAWLPLFGQVRPSTHLTVAFIVGCAYLAAAGAIIGWIIARFDRIVGRAQQN
jgi:ABC-type transport system involved in multi-copper enzyme maturation permease subunit